VKVLITYTLKDRDNPYLRLLVDALVAKGIEVVSPRSGRLWLLRNAMSAPRPDIVHLQWQHGYFTGTTFFHAIRHSAQFFAQLMAIRLAGIPVVWTVHNLINHEGKQGRWELLMCRILARSVNALLVHCDSVVEQVSYVYRVAPGRIRVVPHGHYLGAYPVPKDRASARRNLGLNPDGLVLLFFGQIRAYKGIQELVEVFGRRSDPGIRLILAGEPKMEGLEELRARVRVEMRVITCERGQIYKSVPVHRVRVSGANSRRWNRLQEELLGSVSTPAASGKQEDYGSLHNCDILPAPTKSASSSAGPLPTFKAFFVSADIVPGAAIPRNSTG